MSRGRIEVLRDDLGEHAAYIAWRAVERRAPRPVAIEVLERDRAWSGVFRLHGAGPGGGDVIAKRRPPGELDGERRLYERLLPALAVPTVEWLGFLEVVEEESWLFLEDVGDVPYMPDDALHRDLAIAWVGGLHAGGRPDVDWLPSAGPAYFRGVLNAADEGLRAASPHVALPPDGLEVLDGVRRHLAVAADGWGEVELACLEMPTTLAHGDFVPKNVRFRVRNGMPELVAFDWETAAVGPPAVDVALIPGEDAGRRAYLATVADAWPGVRAADVDAMHAVGRLFRLIHAVWWETGSFRHEAIDHAVRSMAQYQWALGHVLRDRGWRLDGAARA